MSEMYGQYGVFIDEHAWEYRGAWSKFYFNMKSMTFRRVGHKGEDSGDIVDGVLTVDNGFICYKNKTRFAECIQGEFKRYQHWLFEKELLH